MTLLMRAPRKGRPFSLGRLGPIRIDAAHLNVMLAMNLTFYKDIVMRLFALPLLALLFATPASAQTLERIKDTSQMNIGYRADAAPLSFAQADGQPAGYSPLVCVGVAQAIAKSLQLPDLKVSFIPIDTDDRFEKVASGDIDMLCGAATITLERRQTVDFSVPIYVDGTSVLLPKTMGSNFEDLAGTKIGVRSNTTTLTVLEASLKQANIEAEVVKFTDHNAGFDAIKAAEIDAYFADQSILMYEFFTQKMQEQFQQPSPILTLEKQGLALPRGDADFRLAVDTALSEMFNNGTMEQLFKQAFPGVKPGQAVQAMYLMSPTLP